MKARLEAVVTILTLASSLAWASPRDAWYAEDTEDLFWFLVSADVHVGQNLWGGTQDTDNLAWLVGEAFQTIRPRFVFVCGDLVDGTNGGLIPTPLLHQYESEWSEYRAILDAHGMTPEVYVDLPGNHDQYCDKGLAHYRQYSIQGSSDDRTQHALVHETPYGFYHFLAVATPGNDGACWPADNAGLDAGEMDFIKSAWAASEGARLRFAFGHHGVHWGGSNKVGEGAAEFRQLLQKYEVAAYFWGHTHDYFSEYHDGTLFFNVRSLGKNDDRNVALAAVDHNALAVRAFTARKWPFVLITAPADASLGGSNPYAYKVPPGWVSAPVRALVFSVPAPQGVRFHVDSGPWLPMAEVVPGVYQATFDTTGLAEGEHRMRVRADPWSDADHEIRFLVGATVCWNGLDDDEDGLVDFPQDPGCLNPADPDEWNPPPEPDLTDEVGDDLPSVEEAETAGEVIAEPSDEGHGDLALSEEAAVVADPSPDPRPLDAGRGDIQESQPGDERGDLGAEAASDVGQAGEESFEEAPRPVPSVGGGCVHLGATGRPVGLVAWWLVGVLALRLARVFRRGEVER